MKNKFLSQTQIHHIVPKYRCKELGISPNFPGNEIEIIRDRHGMIHSGMYDGDLSPLLEVAPNTPQYILDMIPLGDKRDISASWFIIQDHRDLPHDMKGKNNSFWGKKHKEETLQHLRDLKKDVTGADMKAMGCTFEGRTHTKESRKKMGDPTRGIPKTEKHKRKISKSLTGKKKTAEHCRNLSKSCDHRGEKNPMWNKKHKEETLVKLRAAGKGKSNHPNKIQVKVTTEDGVEVTYSSLGEAERGTGIGRWKLRKLAEDQI